MVRMMACWQVLLMVCPASGALPGDAPAVPVPTRSVPGLISRTDAGWVQWRGPRRDGVCNEVGLLWTWPHEGPGQVWTIQGIGQGWSSPILADNTLYITGDVGQELHIFAYGPVEEVHIMRAVVTSQRRGRLGTLGRPQGAGTAPRAF